MSNTASILRSSGLILALCTYTGSALGEITLTESPEGKYIEVGVGMRGAFSSVQNSMIDTTTENTFSLDSARLYVSGALNENISGILNTEISGPDNAVQVIDAAGIFQLSSTLSVWAGRFISPGSRANLAGPFYSLGGGYWQNIAARYGWNGGVIGRDDGIALIGTGFDERLAFSFGVFDAENIFKLSGVEALSTSPEAADALMYSGRFQYSFWDKEPGYYATGNYLGTRDILTIGMAYRYKEDGAISDQEAGNYSQLTVDFLLEKQLHNGTFSLEAAWFDYDTGGVFLSEEGSSYSIGLGYIFAGKTGWGQLQPFLLYQNFDAENQLSESRGDAGVNYIIDGYNAQLSAKYSKQTLSDHDVKSISLSLQLQF